MFCFLPRRPYRLVQCGSMQKECFSKTVGPKESDTAWSGATLARKALPSMPTWVTAFDSLAVTSILWEKMLETSVCCCRQVLLKLRKIYKCYPQRKTTAQA